MNHRLGSIEGNEVETRGRAWRGIGFEREEGGGGIGNDRVNGYVYIIQMTARLQEARIRRSETIIFAPFREPRASPCLLLMIIYRIPGKRTFRRRRRKKYIQAFNGTSFHPPVFEVDLECLIIFSRLLLSLKKKNSLLEVKEFKGKHVSQAVLCV